MHGSDATSSETGWRTPPAFGTVPHGWPYVSLVDAPRPDGSVERLVSSHFECCDLDQTFVVFAKRGEQLVRLFDNSATPDGRAGFGMWGPATDGHPTILFTADQEVYNYREPAAPEALSRYVLEGEGFALAGAAGPGDGAPPEEAALAGEGEVCRAGQRGVPGPLPEPRDCGPGLTCCYPCGIQGCDFICMDVPDGQCPRVP